MRTLKFISGLILIAVCCSMQLTSCSKKDDTVQVTQTATDGNWRVSLYYDNSDETNKFSGYSFTFNSNGQVIASNGSNTVTGTWSQGSRFTISFGTDPVFSKLNDDWLIEEKNTASIKLKDDNTTKVQQLQFIKL